jgi:hypothetical protein
MPQPTSKLRVGPFVPTHVQFGLKNWRKRQKAFGPKLAEGQEWKWRQIMTTANKRLFFLKCYSSINVQTKRRKNIIKEEKFHENF